MDKPLALVWFRQDLRLQDNPALKYAFDNNYTIIPIYILDDDNAQEWQMGGASKWWLHKSLDSLSLSLNKTLSFFSGNSAQIIEKIVKEHNIQAVFWNRCYEPWRIKRDTKIKERLKSLCPEIKTFNASLLWEPWDISKQDGTAYKVFTPYYRKGCLQAPSPREPYKAPPKTQISLKAIKGLSLDALNLYPKIPWYKNMEVTWVPGEHAALHRLEEFLSCGLKGYKTARDIPSKSKTSRLSPSLHFGEISPHTIWHQAHSHALAEQSEQDMDCFASELGWREFSYYLLYHYPAITNTPLQSKFKAFPWQENSDYLLAWQKGLTGIPLVDAGMRELWQTGYMHNRVRMVTASFLVKNMLQHWHEGEKWFWDTLVDADLASNSASWQWVAGCGADAAPYFRVFNPITQQQKFDPDYEYIKKWIPEFGSPSYPSPILDIKTSRQRALEAYQSIRNQNT